MATMTAERRRSAEAPAPAARSLPPRAMLPSAPLRADLLPPSCLLAFRHLLAATHGHTFAVRHGADFDALRRLVRQRGTGRRLNFRRWRSLRMRRRQLLGAGDDFGNLGVGGPAIVEVFDLPERQPVRVKFANGEPHPVESVLDCRRAHGSGGTDEAFCAVA